MTSTPRPPGPGQGPSPAAGPPPGQGPGPQDVPATARPTASTDTPQAPGGGTGGRQGPAGSGQAEDFFRRIEELGIVRQDENRWIGGVCAGISRRFGLDPILVRGVLVALAVVGGFGLGLYGIAWALLPQTDGVIHAREVTRGRVSSGFVGALFCVLLDLGSVTGRSMGYGGHFWYAPGGLLIVLLIGLGLWWLAGSGRLDYRPAEHGAGPATAGAPPRTATAASFTPQASPGTKAPPDSAAARGTPGGPPAPPATVPPWRRDGSAPLHALTSAVLGIALLAGGGVLLWDRIVQDVSGSPGAVALAVALAVVACGVVLAGAMGRRSGALAPVTILLMIATLSAAVCPTTGKDVTWRPVRASQVTEGYDLGAGDALLDLTTPGLLPDRGQDPLEVRADIGMGRLRILLPRAVVAQVRSSVGLGTILERSPTPSDDDVRAEYDGFGLDHTSDIGGSDDFQVVVDADLGMGSIEILPAEAVSGDE